MVEIITTKVCVEFWKNLSWLGKLFNWDNLGFNWCIKVKVIIIRVCIELSYKLFWWNEYFYFLEYGGIIVPNKNNCIAYIDSCLIQTLMTIIVV
jgi:hypothetical protein